MSGGKTKTARVRYRLDDVRSNLAQATSAYNHLVFDVDMRQSSEMPASAEQLRAAAVAIARLVDAMGLVEIHCQHANIEPHGDDLWCEDCGAIAWQERYKHGGPVEQIEWQHARSAHSHNCL